MSECVKWNEMKWTFNYICQVTCLFHVGLTSLPGSSILLYCFLSFTCGDRLLFLGLQLLPGASLMVKWVAYWVFFNGQMGSVLSSWHLFFSRKVFLEPGWCNLLWHAPSWCVHFPHSTSSLFQSLSSHMIKDRDYTWAIQISQVIWPYEENVCLMLMHGEHQCLGPFSLAKSHGHLRRMSARCICA
jgi:hypothetical protein